MSCVALKMTRQLLVLLAVNVIAGAYLPTKETSVQQESGSALFAENNDRLHMVISNHRFHPVSRDSLPRGQLRKRETVESFKVKQLSVNSNGTSADKKNFHRIMTRSRRSDSVDRTASDFVFPNKPTPFIPKQDVKNCSVDGTDLCVSNVQDYPYRHIQRLLQNTSSHFKSYFTDDVIRIPISTRFDSSIPTDEELTCEAEESILYPKFGKTAGNELLFIINAGEKFKQGIRVEKCKKTGESPCNPKLEAPSGYRTYCKQKYIYRKLLALHPNGEPAPDSFKIPSCCSCFISKITE